MGASGGRPGGPVSSSARTPVPVYRPSGGVQFRLFSGGRQQQSSLPAAPSLTPLQPGSAEVGTVRVRHSAAAHTGLSSSADRSSPVARSPLLVCFG